MAARYASGSPARSGRASACLEVPESGDAGGPARLPVLRVLFPVQARPHLGPSGEGDPTLSLVPVEPEREHPVLTVDHESASRFRSIRQRPPLGCYPEQTAAPDVLPA